jgi:hypothetical protein
MEKYSYCFKVKEITVSLTFQHSFDFFLRPFAKMLIRNTARGNEKVADPWSKQTRRKWLKSLQVVINIIMVAESQCSTPMLQSLLLDTVLSSLHSHPALTTYHLSVIFAFPIGSSLRLTTKILQVFAFPVYMPSPS